MVIMVYDRQIDTYIDRKSQCLSLIWIVYLHKKPSSSFFTLLGPFGIEIEVVDVNNVDFSNKVFQMINVAQINSILMR